MKLLEAMIRPFLVLIMVLGVFSIGSNEKHKRQIYREQVLPALGGKIPEEAFRTDRLALNRLNKEGITVIDGVLLEARGHDKNPDTVRSKPEIIKVYVTHDPRYVPPEGRYHNQHPKAVDTTYVLRKPVGQHDASAQQGLNGNGNAPVHQDHHQYHHQQNNNDINNNAVHTDGCGRSAELPPQSLSPPKAHGFAGFHTFVPYNSPANDRPNQHQHHYPIIYEPIITPLVIPARGTYYRKPLQPNLQHHIYNHQLPWDLSYDWSTFYQAHEPLFVEDNSDFFDSHQIITDYEGFLNDFHGRSYRHTGSQKEAESRRKLHKHSEEQGGINSFSNQERPANIADSDKSERANFLLVSRNATPSYTNLTSIPITSFSCNRRKGTFADVETNCQVFHECSGWSMTSSLCPAGTAYSVTKKRCEWWNTVICDS